MLVKQRVKTSIRIAMVVVASIGLFASSQAYAAETKNTANTLKVSPVRTDIEVKPGENKTVDVTITNITKASITVKPIMNDFVAGDERGTPALILEADQYAPTHSLKRFLRPLPNLTIEPGKARTVKVVINVPKDAQAGGYFGAVRFAPTTPDGGGQVNLSASVASLILLTVPGDMVESLDLTDFEIQQEGKNGAFFQTPNDLQTTVRFASKSNIQVGPFGKVSVKQGDKVVYDADFNNKTPRDMILPDSARRWDVPLKNIGNFGHYTVSATFTYGLKNQTIEVTKSFWVIPQAMIIAAVAGAVLLIGLIMFIWLFLRGYKKRLLRSHSRGRR